MKNKIQKDTYLPLYILIFIVIILWLGSFFAINESIDKRSYQDVFNTINTLFSGLAMAGIIFTIYLQKKELGLQRKELRDTRHEFEIQNETLKKQRFENTYFQLLNLHHEIVDKLTHTSLTDRHYEKRDVFARAIKDFEQELDNAIILQIRMEDEATALGRPFEHPEDFFITNGYGNFFKEYQNSLSHYFRNIYHAFKFVYLSNIINDDEKSFYSAIIRAQLSAEELTLLLYNSLAPGLGYPNFLYLIKAFSILDNLDTNPIPQKVLEIFDKKLEDVIDPFKNNFSA